MRLLGTYSYKDTSKVLHNLNQKRQRRHQEKATSELVACPRYTRDLRRKTQSANLPDHVVFEKFRDAIWDEVATVVPLEFSSG